MSAFGSGSFTNKILRKKKKKNSSFARESPWPLEATQDKGRGEPSSLALSQCVGVSSQTA